MNKMDLNFKDNYYFISDEQILKIPKAESICSLEKLEEYKKKYFQLYDNSICEHLFFRTGEYKNHKFFWFIAFDFSRVEQKTQEKIEEIIVSFLGSYEVIEERMHKIYIYFEQLDFREFINAIYNDFLIKFSVFISGKLSFDIYRAFSIVFESYLQYGYDKNYIYVDNTILIKNIAKKNYAALKSLKPLVLNKVFYDLQLQQVINSMFENNLNVTKTAQSMFMHRNTVIYKLNAIREETDIDVQTFYGAFALYLLLSI